MSNPTLAWESVGFRGSERPTKKWVAEIALHAQENDSFPSQYTRHMEYFACRTRCP